MAMQLSAYAIGRDNNFNLIRFLAAFTVLYSHSFALALGPGDHEPWFARIGYTPASVAVDVFFVTSGFLVTASLFRRGSADWVRARALRILPALMVMSALLVFVLGPLFTTHVLVAYFGDTDTWKFLAKNATTLFGVKLRLPGVFADNPMARMVNGSLWTMPFELRCYITLALAWWGVKFAASDAQRLFTRMVVIATAGLLVALWWSHDAGLRQWHGFRLFFMFFCGTAFWLLRDHVPMRGWIAAALFGVACLGAWQPALFFWIYPPAIAYLVLWCAYVPGGALRAYNRVGDYSYGVYIYAYPVQQAVIAASPGIGVVATFFSATAITLPLAIASWHLVEKPMLARKG